MPRGTTVIPTTDLKDEEDMLKFLEPLVKKRPVVLSEESDEEMRADDEDYVDALDSLNKDAPMEEPETLDAELDITKIDKKQGLIFGWASVVEKNGKEVIDKDLDIIEEAEMEKAAYDFVISCRVGGEDHVRKGVSVLVESFAVTKDKKEALGLPEDFPIGWWTGWKITDKAVLKRAIKGEFTGFSVHGTGKRTPVKKASEMTFNDIRSAVQEAARTKYKGCSYCYVEDLSDSWAVIRVEYSGQGTQYRHETYKHTYTIDDGGVATLADPQKVKRVTRTEYIVTKGRDALARYQAAKEKV